MEAFRDALADDFNTPRAMAEVFELVGEANRRRSLGRAEALREMLELVGLESLAQAERGRGRRARRGAAGGAGGGAGGKDFERADEIRDRLAELGWEVRDSAEGAASSPGAEMSRSMASQQ